MNRYSQGMTATAPLERASVSPFLAAEIRAEIARAGTTARKVAHELGRPSSWLSIRISTTAVVDLTVEEVDSLCQVVGADSEAVIVRALRACRDSNPKPSDLEPLPLLRLIHSPRDPYPQVTGKPALPSKLRLVVA